MSYLRKNSTFVYLALLFIMLSVIPFHTQALDPRLRLQEISGRLYCMVCKKEAALCSCRCNHCRRPYRIGIFQQGASAWPVKYFSNDDCCQCRHHDHHSGGGYLLNRKRKSMEDILQVTKKYPSLMDEQGVILLDSAGVDSNIDMTSECAEGEIEPEFTDEDLAIVQSSPVLSLFELLDLFMDDLGAKDNTQMIQSCIHQLSAVTTMSLIDACVANGLIQTSFPENSLINAVNPHQGYFILSLQSGNNWWPAGIVHLQEDGAVVFLPEESGGIYSFSYTGNDFVAVLLQQLAGVAGTDPSMFSIQLPVLASLGQQLEAMHVDGEPESGTDDSSSTGGSEQNDEELTGSEMLSPDGQLLADLAVLVVSNPRINPEDTAALMAAHLFLHNSVEHSIPEYFALMSEVNSPEGVLTATMISGMFIATLLFSEGAQQNTAVLLVNINGDFVYVLAICDNQGCHEEAYNLVAVFGDRKCWEMTMDGLTSHCGSCKVSLYKKK